jgi:hypothetical protein
MEELMLKFLLKNYPTVRLKVDGHFKRCLRTPNGNQYKLSTDKPRAKIDLMSRLIIVFGCDKNLAESVVLNFL